MKARYFQAILSSTTFKFQGEDLTMVVRDFNSKALPKIHQNFGYNPLALPLDIEIGAGVGWFACSYARLNTERFLISLEHTKEKFEKFCRRFQNNGSPNNLLPLQHNAISWISQCISENSVENIFFMYPNPNPKNLQKRWHAMPFMGELIKKLKTGGCIHLATNEEFYQKEALQYFSVNWNLKNIRNELYKGKARTHFEEKYLLRGESCFDLCWQKVQE